MLNNAWSQNSAPRIVGIVPCYNEEAAITKVVTDLKAAVPQMTVYVYDNNSKDRTAEVAAAAGAVVRTESRAGKGNVVRRAFADIDADIYMMIDGDDTYDTAALPQMIATLQAGPLDHVLGCRTQPEGAESAYRPGHEQGNRMFNRMVGWLFGEPVTDMLSGYRVFSRRFVKSFPALSREFEIETELTVHAMNLRVPQAEVPCGFRDRPAGSESKLRTYHDGFKIMKLIAHLLQMERPLFFYGIFATLATVVAVIMGVSVLMSYLHYGEIRVPTALVAGIILLMALLCLAIGLIAAAVRRARQEASRLAYLRFNPVDWVPVRGIGGIPGPDGLEHQPALTGEMPVVARG